MDTLQEQLNNLLSQYYYNKKILTYNEVLNDEKLTKKLLKENAKLKDVCESYERYKIIEKEIKDLKEQLDSLKENEKILFLEEIYLQNEKLKKENEKILILLSKINAENESINIKLQTTDASFFNFIFNTYIDIFKKNKFVYSLNNNELNANGLGIFNIFKDEIGIHKKIINKKESFCNIFIYKNIQKEDYSFNDKDIKIETYHSNGAGGQNINKVSTAIRATHIKSNITVNCQNERSQFQNKEKALELLKKKVEKFYNNIFQEKIIKQKKEQEMIINQGFVCRTYDFDEKEIKTKFNVNNIITEEFKEKIKLERYE